MKNLFIIATRHNEGKTVLSLGLLGALTKQGRRAGYFKPLGHADQEFGEKRVDADATLMKASCGLAVEASEITPVILEGFPSDLLASDGKTRALERIRGGLSKVGANSEFVVIEGTGNASTGACFGMSNAILAKQMNARVLLMASGGVGQPADEVILNKSYFDREGVEVLGVVVNKVYPHEFGRLNSFMKPLLEGMKLRLFGSIPHDHELARPTLRGLLEQFRGQVITGAEQLNTKVGRFVLGATGVGPLLEQLQNSVTLLCPSDRDDLALAALAASSTGASKGFRLQGIVFAGRTPPSAGVREIMKRTPIPAIHVELDAYSMASMIHSTSYKLLPSDAEGVRRAGELVAKNVDFQGLLDGLKDS